MVEAGAQAAAVLEAIALASQGKSAQARDRLYRALEDGPATAELLMLLGAACFECNQLEQALAFTRACLALEQDNTQAQFQLGVLALMRGDAGTGWAGFAQRRAGRTAADAAHARPPAWAGEPLAGKAILLLGEQGLGDVIQCLRYGPLLREQGATVHLDVHPALRRLVAVHPELGSFPQPGARVEVSTYANMMELPRLLGDHPHGPASGQPYLRVPAGEAAARFGGGGLRVGLVWGGNPRHARDRLRSIGLARLAPLLQVAGWQFFSLQKGERAHEIESLARPHAVVRLDERIEDFYDLALAIETLDLVISVDTAVAHLAGAMGKPVWMLLNTPADWRWGMAGSHTRWYPSMRLFRQPAPGHWETVLGEVKAGLAQWAAVGPDAQFAP